LSVVGPGSTAGSVSIKSLEWFPVWVFTAARFLSGWAWLGWAVGGNIESIRMPGAIWDRSTSDEEGKEVFDESTFNGAGSAGAVVTSVQSLAGFPEGDSRSSGSRVVGNLVWDTGVTGFFSITHGAVVSFSKSLAKGIEVVKGLSFASANVFVKVAPAADFVHGGDGVGDGSGKDSVVAGRVGKLFELSVHVGRVGEDIADESRCDNLHFLRGVRVFLQL